MTRRTSICPKVFPNFLLTRDGQQQEYRTVHVYEIRDGKLAACWEHPRDQSAFDAAWGPRIESARK
jgi:hypothetical protein